MDAEGGAKKKQVMTWGETKDLMMLRMIASEGVFGHKFGSRERGKAWQYVADELNAYPGFNVSSRSVRDRYAILSKKQKMKNSREQQESGGGGDKEPSEIEVILEDLAEIAESTEKLFEEESEKKKESNEKEKLKAVEMRDKAMERFGQTRKRVAAGQDLEADENKPEKVKRRSSSDTLEWLREKGEEERKKKEEEAEQRKEEMELLRQQLILQQQTQKEQTQLMQQQLAQQMQQQQQQQQQQHQQFMMMQQQMLAVIQQMGISSHSK